MSLCSRCSPRGPPTSTLFPYTTLFRSVLRSAHHHPGRGHRRLVGTQRDAEVGDLHIPVQGDQDVRGLHVRSEEHTSELQSRGHLVCRLLLEKKKTSNIQTSYTSAKSHR